MRKKYIRGLIVLLLLIFLFVKGITIRNYYKSYNFFKTPNKIFVSQFTFIVHTLNAYCMNYNSYPSSSEEFVAFINEFEQEYYDSTSPYLKEMIKYGLGLKVIDKNSEGTFLYLYSFGPDYKNDSLFVQLNTPDYNLEHWKLDMNFLEFTFAKGDILLGELFVYCNESTPYDADAFIQADLFPSAWGNKPYKGGAYGTKFHTSGGFISVPLTGAEVP